MRPRVRRGRPRRRPTSTRLAGFLADPLLQTAHVGRTRRGPGVEVDLPARASPTPLPASLLHAAAQLGLAVTGAATGRRVEFGPPVDRRARADVVVRRVVANPVIERWSAGTVEPVLHADGTAHRQGRGRRDRRPVARRAGRDRRASARWRSTPRSCWSIQAPLRRRAAASRPTSSSRRWPRRGASTAPTRRSGRTITTDDGVERPSLIAHAARRAPSRSTPPFVRSAFVGNAGIVGVPRRRGQPSRSRSRPRPTTTRRPSSRSAAPTPASAA